MLLPKCYLQDKFHSPRDHAKHKMFWFNFFVRGLEPCVFYAVDNWHPPSYSTYHNGWIRFVSTAITSKSEGSLDLQTMPQWLLSAAKNKGNFVWDNTELRKFQLWLKYQHLTRTLLRHLSCGWAAYKNNFDFC